DHILNPVYFRHEIENIYAAGGAIFVEIGPKRVLTNLVKDILGDKPHVAVAVNASKSKGSDRQLREAYVQLCVAGLPLRAIDPYSLEFDGRTSDKKSIINVSLAGNNYVSPKTQAAYAEALQNGKVVTAVATPPPAPPKPVVKTAPSAQSKPVTKTSPPLTKPAATNGNGNGNGRSSAQTPKPKIKETEKSMHDPSEFQTRLEKSLALLHQHQAETARVHETFLKGQETYANSVVQLMQAFKQASGGSNGSTQVSPQGDTPQSKRQSTTPSKPTNGTVAKKTPAPAVVPVPSMAPPPAMPKVTAPPPAQPKVEPVTPQQAPAPVVPAPVVPTPVVPTPVVETAVPTTQPSAFSAELEQAMLVIVSEKTGYPVEMLEMHMDMESDLGIDSIKRVEILGAMQKQHPELPEVNPAELAELRTLQQIVDHLQPSVAQSQTGAAPVAPPAPAPVVAETVTAVSTPQPTAAKVAELAQSMLVIVSEKTGYPVEMLEMHMDMESDLGIDSIKRVEILGAMQKQHPELPEVNPAELAELRTLQQIVDHLQPAVAQPQNGAAPVAAPAPAPVVAKTATAVA
ncbi:MAG: polyketide synthase, partial [Chloroflexi bacterium]|nr:polyketide synthase [Chloroflexota bacterium]